MSHHFVNIAVKHIRLYFQDKQKVFLKKYFYVIRPLLCVSYLKKYHTVPPVQLQVLLKHIEIQDDKVLQAIELLLKEKKEGSLSKIETDR